MLGLPLRKIDNKKKPTGRLKSKVVQAGVMAQNKSAVNLGITPDLGGLEG